MGIFDRKPQAVPPRLTASAGIVVSGGNPAVPSKVVARMDEWQKRVLAFEEAIGEVSHAATFVENTIGRAKIVVEDQPVLTALLKSFPLGRSARNFFLVGEFVAAFKFNEEDMSVKWDAWGKEDIRSVGPKINMLTEAGTYVPIPDDVKYFNIWRPSTSNRFKATSAHKALLDVLESLYIHQLADAAVATSRLAGAGFLYMPNDELSQAEAEPGERPLPGTQQEMQGVIRDAMTDSLKNRNAADAIVPVIVFGSSEHAEGMRHILMERPDDAKAYAERIEAYRKRYGSSIELPVEVVTGMGETNHWASWKVDQNTFAYYLEPMAKAIAEALVEGFLSQVAEALGITDELVIKIDGTAVVVKPDRTDAAIRMFAAGAMSAEAALVAAGFSAEDIAPFADRPGAKAGTQPDGNVRMPSANYRGSEGSPVGDRNFER